jgi:rhodanese-related sulfurtransferase
MTHTPRVLAVPASSPQAAAARFAADLDDLVRDLKDGDRRGYVVVETRSPEAFEAAHIPGAINLPYRDMTAANTGELDRDLVYICYCESFQCNAATKGALKLAELGFRVKRLAGGIRAWESEGYPVERTDDRVPAPNCAC